MLVALLEPVGELEGWDFEVEEAFEGVGVEDLEDVEAEDGAELALAEPEDIAHWPLLQEYPCGQHLSPQVCMFVVRSVVNS